MNFETNKNFYKHKDLDAHGEKILQLFTQGNIIVTEQILLDILSIQKNVEKILDGEIFIKDKKKRGGKLNFEKWQEKISKIL